MNAMDYVNIGFLMSPVIFLLIIAVQAEIFTTYIWKESDEVSSGSSSHTDTNTVSMTTISAAGGGATGGGIF